MGINAEAAQYARDLWGQDIVILDTETTGLGDDAEIVEISILDKKGNSLLDTLVKPKKSIPAAATKIHGINNKDVADAPTWEQVYPQFRDVIKNKVVVIYNSQYDNKIIKQVCAMSGVPNPRRKSECAMLLYSDYINIINPKTGNTKWHKLTDAVAQCGIPASNAHRAKGDCEMTLNILKHMACVYDGEKIEPVNNTVSDGVRKLKTPRKYNDKKHSEIMFVIGLVFMTLTAIIKMAYSVLKVIFKK
ncbi:exonuclease domain-containing protein [Klebsiella sp. NPDC088457]